MSYFNKKDKDPSEDLPKYLRSFNSGGKNARELSDSEKLEADPFSSLSLLPALVEEFKLVEWPKASQVFKQTIITFAALVASVFFVITLDTTLKNIYMAVGLYPK